MNVVRKSIRLSEDGQIQRDMSDETFWDGVVADAIAILEPGRVSDNLSVRVIIVGMTSYSGVHSLYRQLSMPTRPALRANPWRKSHVRWWHQESCVRQSEISINWDSSVGGGLRQPHQGQPSSSIA